MKPFTAPIRPENVEELIDFTVPGNPETKSMATMQTKGVAALYNILYKSPVAYLADEVGMGKTYQALALAALVWNQKPEARILFVSPRQNLQEKWVDDYMRFFRSNYLRSYQIGDDRVTSVLFGDPIHRPASFDNLRSWAPIVGMPERIALFLRHTSFMRPVFVNARDLTGDMDGLWSHWQDRFKSWALFESTRPKDLSRDNASRELNLAFARSLNRKLSKEATNGEPYFDLVILDEAQCLRHPENQTNSVLYEILHDQVAKWLFMSATPAHGGAQDIPTVVNRYSDSTVLDWEFTGDLAKLQEALRDFMVRRQRRYVTNDGQTDVGKSDYRDHVKEQWAVKDAEMSVLSTLAMGLVQKGLVDVLASRNNRYRIGFLSSFESLQSSIRPVGSVGGDRLAPDSERHSDFEHDPTEVHRDERDAPDAEFIDKLATDFEKRFDMPLPHAKVTSVIDRIAPLAFGSDTEMGGRKFLIFTRRVSTVHALRDRLVRAHRLAVERRMLRCWGIEHIDWAGNNTDLDDMVDDEDSSDSEAHEGAPGDDLLRQAMAKGGWLHRYRQTFRASGRNSLFFEDGWLERLCEAGGKDPSEAARNMPVDIWAESWNHASRTGGTGSHHRANRLRYLAVQGIQRVPEVFGLSQEAAKPWCAAYKSCLHNHLSPEKVQPDADPHLAPELFTWPTLWAKWDSAFAGTSLLLPAHDPADIHGDFGRDELCRRQVIRTILGQTFRLTDTLLDLYFADKGVGKSSERLADQFLGWLASDDLGAGQLRTDCAQWLAHLRLIVDSCLGGAGRPWHELVHEREEAWTQLYEPKAAVGVTGGTGGNRSAIRQFRTPSLPRVIVCTDTLKEGVDLHLFCDSVLHYGVAWTSGDMEQRTGRVDRYFSQIERRLAGEGSPPDVKLHVGYPHVFASLERKQVERVIQRQREVEALMDSPLAGTGDDEREIVVGVHEHPSNQPKSSQPFGELRFPSRGRKVAVVSLDAARAERKHYLDWYGVLRQRWLERNWRIEADGSMVGHDVQPVSRATLVLEGEERQHEIEWGFDGALSRYVMTVSSPPWPTRVKFSGGERRHALNRGRQSFVRLLVPTPDEGADETAIEALIDALLGKVPQVLGDAKAHWGEALASLSSDSVAWGSDHKARLTVRRGARDQRVTVYAYEGSVRAVSVVSAALDGLRHRDGWQRPPTSHDLDEWILDTNNILPLGYLDRHERDGLVFGIHVLHGNLSTNARRRLLEEVGWRADAWEASLTGTDQE